MVAVRGPLIAMIQYGVVPGRRREAHLGPGASGQAGRPPPAGARSPGADCGGRAESVVCLHATDPATVYLSAWARMDDMTVADLDGVLLRRSFHRQAPGHATNAVRALGSCRRSRRRSEQPGGGCAAPPSRQGGRSGGPPPRRRPLVVKTPATRSSPHGWWPGQLVRAPQGDRAARGRDATYGEGRSGGRVSVGPRVLTILSAEGRIVRATNAGGWYVSRPRWASMEAWLGAPIDVVSPEEESPHSYGRGCGLGPGTVADLQWWLGSTLTAVRRALVDVEAIEVDVDGQPGFVLPDDLEPTEDVRRGPPCCHRSTRRRWVDRAGVVPRPHKADLFDTAATRGRPSGGTGGSSAAGAKCREEVELQLLEDAGSAGRRAIKMPPTGSLPGSRAAECSHASPPRCRGPSPASRDPTGSAGRTPAHGRGDLLRPAGHRETEDHVQNVARGRRTRW